MRNLPIGLKVMISPSNLTRSTAGFALVLAVTLGVLFTPQNAPAHAPGLAITLTDAQVLELPKLGLQPIATLSAGSTVVLTGDVAPGFVNVTFDGGSGWVIADLLSVSGRAGIDTIVVTSRTLILDAPFPDAHGLVALEPGDAVVLTGATVGDYAAASRDGVGGWINRSDIGATPLE